MFRSGLCKPVFGTLPREDTKGSNSDVEVNGTCGQERGAIVGGTRNEVRREAARRKLDRHLPM